MTTSQPPVYNGRYELRNQVARGGTAQVYLARDIVLDRPVALKVLFPELSSDHSFVERFRREAQAAANLSHPNIVPVFDWGESERTYFIVMEYVDGETLSSIIRTQAPLPAKNAASIAAEIAKALSYAHRHGVVHRDVKPGNVLITSDGEVKVTDFGIARAIGANEQITQTGLVMGTATYFSPEQAQGLGVDGRSDVYALGVVLYEMVTGRPPFSGDSPVAIAYQHVQENPPPVSELNPNIPVELGTIIAKAMAKSPAERYATADEMRADLERFGRGEAINTRPAPLATTEALGAVTGAVPPAATRTFATLRTDGADLPEKRTTSRWVAAAAVLVVALGLLVFFGGRALGYFGGGSYFAVPKVTGMTQAKALQKLTAKGLKYRVDPERATSVGDAGKVVAQSPKPPANVRSGQLVVLHVAGSAPSVEVPYVVNDYLDAAKQKLGQKNLKTTIKWQKAASGQAQNLVIDQSPVAGTSITEGDKVTLTVVRGTSLVPIPDLSGDNQSTAGAKLADSELNPSATPEYQFSSTIPQGDVIASKPAQGVSIEQGETVTLIVSKGPAISVPDLLQGITEQAAEQELQNAGLRYRVGPPVTTTQANLVGNVAKQSPKAGTPVEQNFVVTIYIGEAPPSSTTTATSTPTPPSTPTGTSG